MLTPVNCSPRHSHADYQYKTSVFKVNKNTSCSNTLELSLKTMFKCHWLQAKYTFTCSAEHSLLYLSSASRRVAAISWGKNCEGERSFPSLLPWCKDPSNEKLIWPPKFQKMTNFPSTILKCQFILTWTWAAGQPNVLEKSHSSHIHSYTLSTKVNIFQLQWLPYTQAFILHVLAWNRKESKVFPEVKHNWKED